jgi:hypothetical protein
VAAPRRDTPREQQDLAVEPDRVHHARVLLGRGRGEGVVDRVLHRDLP